MSISPEGILRPLRFDPDGCPIGPEVPEELLIRWKGMLANCGKAQGRMHSSYERFFKEQEACNKILSGLLGDASGIADDIRALVDLSAMALDCDDVPAPFAEAFGLVLNCLRTMADRARHDWRRCRPLGQRPRHGRDRRRPG